MDWHELSKKKVTDLREIAKEKGMVGATGYQKDELVSILAEHLGITRPHKVVDAADKAEIKAKIRELKVERAAALEAGDKEKLHQTRRQIHRLKRKVRKMAHLSR